MTTRKRKQKERDPDEYTFALLPGETLTCEVNGRDFVIEATSIVTVRAKLARGSVPRRHQPRSGALHP